MRVGDDEGRNVPGLLDAQNGRAVVDAQRHRGADVRRGIGDLPHPGGANVTDWTEWKIPLAEFIDAGVNMAAVRKMIIGAGNRTAPVAGGDGMVLIDDITVVAPAPVDPNEG